MTGMGNLFEMLKNAKSMMEKAKQAQGELAKQRAEGTAGAGMVNATVNGLGELVGLKFDKDSLDPSDLDMLADLVIAAVADARQKVDALRAETVKQVAGGVDLAAMGLDISSLL